MGFVLPCPALPFWRPIAPCAPVCSRTLFAPSYQCILIYDSTHIRARPLSLTRTHELGLARWRCTAAEFLAHAAAVRQAAGPPLGGNLALEHSCACSSLED